MPDRHEIDLSLEASDIINPFAHEGRAESSISELERGRMKPHDHGSKFQAKLSMIAELSSDEMPWRTSDEKHPLV